MDGYAMMKETYVPHLKLSLNGNTPADQAYKDLQTSTVQDLKAIVKSTIRYD